MNDMNNTYQIKEDGRNGTVTVTKKGLLRSIKKFRKNDEQFIPWSSVDYIKHDKRLRTDIISVQTPSGKFEWKTDAADHISATFQNL